MHRVKNIFYGLIFVFLDFNLVFNQSSFDVLPDFAGYLFIIGGLIELSRKSRWFQKARPFATGMAIYTGIIFLLDALGASPVPNTWGSLALGFISTLVSLQVSYDIVMGIREIEAVENRPLRADALYYSWKIMTVLTCIVYAMIWIPFLNIVSIIFGLIAGIYFLNSFNKTKNLYCVPVSTP